MMKTVNVRNFTSQFTRYRRQAVVIHSRGKLLGTWTPAPARPERINLLDRVREDFSAPLPFTGHQLLKESKKR
jgi:hypothetical protein